MNEHSERAREREEEGRRQAEKIERWGIFILGLVLGYIFATTT